MGYFLLVCTTICGGAYNKSKYLLLDSYTLVIFNYLLDVYSSFISLPRVGGGGRLSNHPFFYFVLAAIVSSVIRLNRCCTSTTAV